MQRIRAVVEISIPDNQELSEDDFAKQLRRHMPKSLNLSPHEMATRPIQFKAFYRVVQYGPEGTRIVPPKTPDDHVDSRPSQFQFMVLNALWIIILAVVFKADIKARSRSINFMSAAIGFGDLYGVPGDDAKRYRRHETFWHPDLSD